MQFFEILQVIIAIIFIYLILSLLASELQEAIATFIEFRSRNLRKSIAILLNELDGNTPFTDLIYDTQTIKSLNQYTNSSRWWSWATKFLNVKWLWFSKTLYSSGPSYIDKETFTDTVIKVLQDMLGKETLESNTKMSQIVTKLESITTNNQIEFIPPSFLSEKLRSTLMQDYDRLQSVIDQTGKSDAIKRLIEIAKSVQLKKGSEALLQEFRAELEKLFEQAQERTSGVYKRNAKGMSFIIGLLLAFGLNVDVIYMVNALNKNPQLAGNLSNVANDLLAENNTAFQEFQDCIKKLEAEPEESECDKKLTNFKNDLRDKLSENDANIEDIIFWTEDPFSQSK